MSKKKRRDRKKRHAQQKRAAATPAKLIEKGDFRGAAALLEARLQSDPSDHLLRTLAHCHIETSDYAKAASTLLEIEEKTASDLTFAGWCLIQLEDWDRATDIFRDALEIEETAEDLFWLAVARAKGYESSHLLLEDETKTSVTSLLEAAIKLPNCRLEAFLWLEELQVGPDVLEKRAAILREAIDHHAESLEARTRLADLLMSPRYGKSEEALDVISSLLEGESPPTIALCYAFNASKKLGDFEQALTYLEAIKLDPARTEIDLALIKGDTLVSLGRLNEAIDCYDEAIEQGDLERRILGHFGRAWAAVAAKHAERAVLEAQRAADLWFGAIVEDNSFALYNRYIVIGGEGFSYWEHNASVRAVCQSLLHKEEYEQRLNDDLRGLLYYLAYKEQVENLDDEESERMLSKAYEILGHPLISEDLSYCYLEPGKISRGVYHHLNYSLWKHATRDPSKPFPSYLAELDFVNWDDRHRAGEGDYLPIHQTALTHLESCGEDEIRDVIVPFYASFWRTVLFEGKMFEEVVQVTGSLLEYTPDSGSVLFDHAYGLEKIGKPADAEATYKTLIELEPSNPNAMHNLSILLEERNLLEEALELSSRAARLAPDDELITRRASHLEDKMKLHLRELQRKQEFLSTAPVRWPHLDYYKKQLLVTLDLIDSFEDFGHLSRLSGIEERFVSAHYRKLVEQGMLIEYPDGSFKVNEHVAPLIKRERSHSIATKIVHSEPNISWKPIFNSRQEYTVYNILIGIFPNHLVFPNMALQTIFQYDRMKELLTAEEFRYFLMSQADFCVTSTANYLPIMALELDSDYHDSPKQLERDTKKDQIFRLGGVPLLRLRPHGRPSIQEMRQDIVEAVQALVEELSVTGESSGIYSYFLQEIEAARLGSNHTQKSTGDRNEG